MDPAIQRCIDRPAQAGQEERREAPAVHPHGTRRQLQLPRLRRQPAVHGGRHQPARRRQAAAPDPQPLQLHPADHRGEGLRRHPAGPRLRDRPVHRRPRGRRRREARREGRHLRLRPVARPGGHHRRRQDRHRPRRQRVRAAVLRAQRRAVHPRSTANGSARATSASRSSAATRSAGRPAPSSSTPRTGACGRRCHRGDQGVPRLHRRRHRPRRVSSSATSPTTSTRTPTSRSSATTTSGRAPSGRTAAG
jgi:hypothetical protein